MSFPANTINSIKGHHSRQKADCQEKGDLAVILNLLKSCFSVNSSPLYHQSVTDK